MRCKSLTTGRTRERANTGLANSVQAPNRPPRSKPQWKPKLNCWRGAGGTLLKLRRDELAELLGVGVEETDAFGGFLRGHRVFIEQPAEFLFVEGEPIQLARGRQGGTEF